MATFIDAPEKVFIKGVPKPEDKNNQLTALQKAGSLIGGYLNLSDDPLKVELDVVKSLTSTVNYVIAEFAIEDGTFLSDNTVKDPETVDIEATITDTPTDPINPLSGSLRTYKGRSADIASNLKKILDNNITVTIVADNEIYKDMLMNRFVKRRDEGTGFAISISMGFKKRRTVKQQGGTSTDRITDDVRNAVGVGDAIGLITLLPLVV